ncbi:putative transmembrane protein [Phocaeicola vulgatus]|uniref:Putative transmembrane protein n=2 Tax=Phocaeicola vulgatus TaxID=821 RepID=A0A173ZD28_PHOVU|nr:putative transmembrane protein [Phocaeicola vulgatus]
MEAKSETNKQISSFLFILWAGGAALLSYSLVYALRKPFTAATFDGMDFFGMDYKVATTIMQIFGYLISKFFAIKIVSELKREDRLKFMVCSVALAELALVFFGLLPQPFNVFALFFNGLALGCMWGVIFSFIEGRKVTDILASLLGVSMAVSSGMAKYIEYKNKIQEKCNYCTTYQCISVFYKKNVELHLLLILAIDSVIYSFYVTILLCKKAPVFD